MHTRFLPRLLGMAFAGIQALHSAEPTGDPGAAPWNRRVLSAVRAMPSGGGYSANDAATDRLQSAVQCGPNGILIEAEKASPSYCSGGTYLVLLKVLTAALKGGELRLDDAALRSLLVLGQRDGDGVWGRWNANGPGTARLFHELKLGRNFTEWQAALPGDFLKIFWTAEIGKLERGHSVIFLGVEQEGGKEFVRFWSSNNPDGYGGKVVPRSDIVMAVFSRLERPENLRHVATLPLRDRYLGNLMSVRSSVSEMRRWCGL